jgi:hypothetical protein
MKTSLSAFILASLAFSAINSASAEATDWLEQFNTGRLDTDDVLTDTYYVEQQREVSLFLGTTVVTYTVPVYVYTKPDGTTYEAISDSSLVAAITKAYNAAFAEPAVAVEIKKEIEPAVKQNNYHGGDDLEGDESEDGGNGEALSADKEGDSDDSAVADVSTARDEEETASVPEAILVEVKKPVVVYPTLAVHNVFRNNMVSVLNRIKPHQTVTSDQEFYVQSFKGSKASRIESTTAELNTRVYIESTSLYSNVKNKETLRQTGGTVGFDYENIGFCFSDLTGELNQYDLDSRLYSVYAGFSDQHKVVLSYGDHDLGNFDGDSYGALYEFNYDNFVADVAYTNTKFDQESLKTYMVGVGYTVAGNVVGPINGSIKGMVIQDFGDHKDQYGAKQGSTGILVSGMLQTNLTNNLGVYLMASGEVRRHATGASAALGVELAF